MTFEVKDGERVAERDAVSTNREQVEQAQAASEDARRGKQVDFFAYYNVCFRRHLFSIIINH